MSLFAKRGLNQDGSKGFTLIELLVVVAIIGILSSIVLASLTTARKKGRDARRISDLKQLQLALELYYDSHPTTGYPTTAQYAANLVSEGFIAVVPTDPQTGAAYLYSAHGALTVCSSYHLGSTLEITNNSALSSDADLALAAQGAVCTGGGTDFAGTDPIYDVRP